MEFGLGLPTRGPMATPHSLATLAHKGEELGFAILSVSDHLIIPRQIASIYPYNESGAFASDPSGACMEQLTLLSFLAGVTSTAKLLRLVPWHTRHFWRAVRTTSPSGSSRWRLPART